MIVGLVEVSGGTPIGVSLEALTFGRRLAERLGVALHAVLVDDGGSAAEVLASYGASTVHVVRHERLDAYAPGAWARAIVELVDALGPRAVIAAGTDRGNEVMAHVAARIGLPMAANCTEVEPEDPWTVTRQRWGGSLLEEVRLEGAVKLLTVAAHAVAPEEAQVSGGVVIEMLTPKLDDDDLRVRVAGLVPADGGRISLPEARVVVGGGRGVGSPEAFATLEELAGLLGGTVGVSRVVTSLGWRPHADQIGQTGTRIAPDLYIACGISGAIQHLVGCKAAKRILAINTDSEAPIMARADYAVIGDLHQILPALNAEIRKAKQG